VDHSSKLTLSNNSKFGTLNLQLPILIISLIMSRDHDQVREKGEGGHTAVQSEWTTPSGIYPVYKEWSVGTGECCLEDCASNPGTQDENDDDSGMSVQVLDITKPMTENGGLPNGHFFGTEGQK
jgi:hypothetical protein